VCDLETSRMGAPYIYDISHLRVKPYSVIIWFNLCAALCRLSSLSAVAFVEFVLLHSMWPHVCVFCFKIFVLCIFSPYGMKTNCCHYFIRILLIQSTRPERYRYWTNGCVNSCVNSPEDGPVGPKRVETQQYTNKIVISVGFHGISSVCVWCSCLLVICLWTCFIHFTCYEVIISYIYCRYFVVYIYLLFAVFSLDSRRFLFCISLCQDICSLATV